MTKRESTVSHLPTLEEYGLAEDVYSSFKIDLEKLNKKKDDMRPSGFLVYGIIFAIVFLFFLLLSIFTGHGLGIVVIAIISALIGFAYGHDSFDFWANVLSHGQFKKTEEQIANLAKTAHSTVEPFENALHEYSRTLLDQHFETKLYKKHSGTPAFEEALLEFEAMINTCSTANGFLLTKHFNLQEYEEYLKKRQIDQLFKGSKWNIQKIKKTSEEFDSIDNLVKKVSQASIIEKILPPEEAYRIPRKIDWESINKDRKMTGDQGEKIAVAVEREYLKSMGREDLANKIRHVSIEDGDGLGYDILSFFPDGREKFIEVKTTNQKIGAPFYLSRNEYAFVHKNTQSVFIYRISITSQAENIPQLEIYNSDNILHAEMTPTQYIVKI